MSINRDPAGRPEPVFNSNRMKLGIFGANVSGGCSMTLAEGACDASWDLTRQLAVTADRAGWELMLPVARWRGLGGRTDFNGTNLETYTWAAGIGAVTEQIQVFATSHVPTVHPVMAAKQATTIDHITNGRFGLNIVSGWFEDELGMFSVPQRAHDQRYQASDEWITVMKRLWTESELFDFEGEFFRVPKAVHKPKPVQKPYPVLISAGTSPAGRRFAAKHTDFNFVIVVDLDDGKRLIDDVQQIAWNDFHRRIGFMASAYVVCRPTEKEAREYLRYYVDEVGDWEAVDNLMTALGGPDNWQTLPPDVLRDFKRRWIAGWGGYPLVGTPEMIVDELLKLSAIGIEGIVLSWVDYARELPGFIDEVVPLMEQAGLRRPALRKESVIG